MFTDSINFIYIVIFIAPFAVLRFYPFLDKLRISVKTLLLLYFVLILVQASLFCFATRQPFWDLSMTQRYQLTFSIFNSILSFFLVREKIVKQIFVWGIAFSLAGFIMTNANFVESLFFARFTDSVPYYTFTNIISALQIIIIFPFAIKHMKQNVRPALQIASGKSWHIVWIIFILLYSGTFLTTGGLGFDRSDTLYDYLIRIFCFGSIIGSSVIFSVALKQTGENIHLEEKANLSERQLALEREYFQAIVAHIDETKAARHDLRHHLTLLQAYSAEGKKQELEDYIGQYLQTVAEDSTIILCKNYAVDTIVRHYIEKSKRAGIQADVLLNLPEKITIAESDLCVVFGNLLENSLEACTRQKTGEKFITVSAALVGEYIIITIDNSYEGSILKENDVFLSSKRDGKGIGITSVQAVSDKYYGEVKFEFSDQIFRSSVMLKQ
ncbi:GHKL domain-containing protein [Fusibacter ferrireducens]|uniref:GHKL domain-containing protein n=1 Tax=Fusibacter ferrireducens TaxID=2785058 RepID=A0ABR9ZP39_9FIRM|nr:sensor histidine kinase [Fusibacter ferrireducens]MBF4692232.1 GHKL domain-containing protein [Fusibacter ferrireducens]